MKKIKNPVSIGSYGEKDAQYIAGTLSIHLGIHANVVNVKVESGSTTWFAVEVPSKSAKLAETFVKGWRAGRAFMCMETNPACAPLWPEYAAFFPTSTTLGPV